MIDIFCYQDYRQFLKDFYQSEKKRNPAFSFRFFARRAELPSFNYLKLVMDGKRNLTADYLERFVKGLKLDGRKAKYFKTMVLLNQSNNANLKAEYLKKLIEIQSRVAARELLEDQSNIYTQWYHWVIREMTLLKDFSEDPKWISKKLGRAITPLEAKESLDLLFKLGLLIRENNKIVPSNKAIRSSDEVVNLALMKLHEAFIQKAIDALLNVSMTEREFAGLTIALKKERLPFVKNKIKKLRQELNEILSADEQAEEVYQLNMQFFPLTKGGI